MRPSKRSPYLAMVRMIGITASLALGPSGYAKEASAPSQGVLQRLAWLKGCWLRDSPNRVVEEQWMVPRGGAMLGMSRTVSKSDNRLVEFEAMRIEESGGRLVFTSKPSGQTEDSFTSIELTDSLVVFENKEHDFPQRVGYRLRPDGGLAAWIEGRKPKDAPLRRVDFPYERASCP